jgi:hypothetical protein
VAAGLAYAACDPAGVTASDNALADALRPQMNGQRLGGAINGYNVSCARVITATVASRSLDKRAAVIAVTTAITESTLHNYTQADDYDSLGLFQQRPSQGWGTSAQVTDPVYATNAFLNAMLRKFPNNSWMSGDIGSICQAVQVSAVPDAYDHEVHDAGLLVDALWGSGGVRPAMVLTSGGWLQVLVRDAGGGLRNVWMDRSSGVWRDGGVIATGVAGNPALTVGPDGNTVAVYRSTNGYLYEIYMDRNSGVWTNVGPLTSARPAGDPVVTVTSGGWLQVLVRDTGGGLRNIWMDKSAVWHDGGAIATGVAGNPALTVGGDGNTVAVYRSTNGYLYENYMDRNSGVWSNVGPIAGVLPSGDPALALDVYGNLNAVVPATSHTLQQTWMNKSTGIWAGAQTIANNIN